MEEKCELAGGFTVRDLPTEKENEAFQILENAVREMFEGFFEKVERMPERRIITNQQAIYNGMAKVYKKGKKTINNSGIWIRYEVGSIYLKRTLFGYDKFFKALSTYVHEMCHCFGGDSSDSFSLGLTEAMECIMGNL